MPDTENGKYGLAGLSLFFKEEIILVGHSLGGIFLAKYLSENTISKTIKAVALVAAPFDDKGSEESLVDFRLPFSLKRFSEQAAKIYLFYSKDDPVVPFEQSKKYKKAIPSAKLVILDNRKHFNQETFPEITKLIKTLYSRNNQNFMK